MINQERERKERAAEEARLDGQKGDDDGDLGVGV